MQLFSRLQLRAWGLLGKRRQRGARHAMKRRESPCAIFGQPAVDARIRGISQELARDGLALEPPHDVAASELGVVLEDHDHLCSRYTVLEGGLLGQAFLALADADAEGRRMGGLAAQDQRLPRPRAVLDVERAGLGGGSARELLQLLEHHRGWKYTIQDPQDGCV